MPPKYLAIVSVVGRDQKGIVARVSTYLAEHEVNIEDIEQRVIHGQFMMDMLVDLAGLRGDLDSLIEGLNTIGRDLGMSIRVMLHRAGRRRRVAVLVSKEPHCLARLIDDAEHGALRGDIVVVLSNHEVLRPMAEEHGIPFFACPAEDMPAHEDFLLEKLREHQADLVVLARYMRILSARVVEPYAERMINIHPSLLPYFPGPNPYRRAWEDGVRVTGCTAHFVTQDLDAGPIILQDVFQIDVGEDSEADVRTKGRALEAEVLSRAVQLYLNDEIVMLEGKVVFKPGMRTFLKDLERTAD
ncbi:MAG TPA: ACT domain-containing protein [Dehalococcoidia bacterium]|nr:ACT domain-containing protein [Dehalococcoidia bacterium]